MKSNWLMKAVDEEITEEFSKVLGINKFTSSILFVRGITNKNEAFHFLNPKLSNLHSPFLMKGMYECVIRIREAIDRRENIGIFADSDVDGFTSLTILVNLFERIGIQPYCRYAVEDEAYGLRKEIIDEMYLKKINLLITVDCGIRDIDEIKYARELGIDVIVCDHHEQKCDLPPAMIINPKLWDSSYPFKELAGVGVTFKLCHGILLSYLQSFNKLFIIFSDDEDGFYLSFIKNGIIEKIKTITNMNELAVMKNNFDENSIFVVYDPVHETAIRDLLDDIKIYTFKDLIINLPEKKIPLEITIDTLCEQFLLNKNLFNKKYEILNSIFFEIEYTNSIKIIDFLNSIIDLVSLGTVADIMPVSGENRTIIHHGLKSLNSTKHPGLSFLVKKIDGSVTAKKIAWDISPLLNTPGRFGKTDLLAKFFLEKDSSNINSVINEINKLNEERKRLISELYNTIISEIQNGMHIAGENLIFVESEKVPEGLCGLLANRIADTTGKPVIIISLWNNKEVVKGSGRAVGDFNFFPIVEAHSSLFQKIGGHKQAFGFTIDKKEINTVREKIIESIDNHLIRDSEYNIDLDIPIEAITFDFIKNLNLFEPYGYKNDECLFLTRNVILKDFKRFGKNRNHGKYIFKNNSILEAIGWDLAETMEQLFIKKEIDIIYKLENNYYNGKIVPRMLIIDLD